MINLKIKNVKQEDYISKLIISGNTILDISEQEEYYTDNKSNILTDNNDNAFIVRDSSEPYARFIHVGQNGSINMEIYKGTDYKNKFIYRIELEKPLYSIIGTDIKDSYDVLNEVYYQYCNSINIHGDSYNEVWNFIQETNDYYEYSLGIVDSSLDIQFCHTCEYANLITKNHNYSHGTIFFQIDKNLLNNDSSITIQTS